MNLIGRYVSKAFDRYYLFRYVHPFNKRNSKRQINSQNTIALFSFPRSGSTWLSELLLTIPNSCLFDEPLQRNHIESPNELPDFATRKLKEVAELDFYFFQPIPRNAEDEDVKSMMKKLLKGEAVSIGMYDDYGLHRLEKAEVFLIKFNYGMLLSSWLLKNFQVTALFLIRNPYACIASILQHQLSQKLIIPDEIKVPDFRYNEIYLQYESIYRSIKTPEEYYAFLWCLNFKEGFEKNKSGSSLIVFYEDLLMDYEQEITRIFDHLKKPIPPEIFDLQLKPSSSTYDHSLKSIAGQDQLEAWKKHLTPRQKNNIGRIIKEFGIKIYEDTLLPNKALI